MHSAFEVTGDRATLLDYGYVHRVHARVYEEDAIRTARGYAAYRSVSLASTTSSGLQRGLECAKLSEHASGCHGYGESPKLAKHMRKPFPGFMTIR